MVPPCVSTIVRAIVSPIPRPCAFVVTNGVNSVPSICAGKPVPASRTETSTSAAPDFGADGDATTRRRRLGHRVHGVHYQVHQHLLQEHLIAADDAGMRRQIDRDLDLPRPHVVRDERKTFIDHVVQVDRLRVQLMASEHGPMPIDDLRGLDTFGLDIGEDLVHRAGRRLIGGDHHPTRLRVVDHRAERLTEFMRNRVRQRRHRLATTGVAASARWFRLSRSARRRARR